MAEPDWTRPRWSRDEARAMLVYFVFGEFAAEPTLDLSAHGSQGLPQGVEILRIPKERLAHWQGHPLRGALGDILRDGNPAAFETARKAPECLLLRGELADPDSLAYLRDTLGVISALLDAGGIAVVDPQILELFSAEDWRVRYAGGNPASSRRHVAVLCSDGAADHAWIHTRGLRKFARPDISIRGVPREQVQHAGEVAARLAELQVQGMRFGDGSTVDVEGIPGGLTVTRAGSLEDPEFNNTHLEMDWPSA
ncbi:MAG TPA: hypothetical protein VFK00_08860 [Rhodanobacteraceae bacterium]|jgi:hypothetical protein|nr:hypothetical protein [Rhodanobacteraceae bacterium]